MAKKKRITRKELLKEPDEFLTLSSKIIRFAQNNQKQMSYVGIGVVVLLLGFFAYRYMSSLSERRAYALFEEGFSHYMAQSFGQAQHTPDPVSRDKFIQVLEKYSSTKAARLTEPLLADTYAKTGDYDKAIELYNKALEDFPEEPGLRAIFWNGLGYALEGKKDYKAAAEAFRRITTLQGDFLKAEAYFNLGRMYELMGDKEKASAAFKQVADAYPDSMHGAMAKEKVAQLNRYQQGQVAGPQAEGQPVAEPAAAAATKDNVSVDGRNAG
ncbi:MAG: tetratricopeptide repeat protein [Deltaproteobacteria bacterium]|nr:tetratricopeptide repeat protein [Deltaproteobacteria bacterium]